MVTDKRMDQICWEVEELVSYNDISEYIWLALTVLHEEKRAITKEEFDAAWDRLSWKIYVHD